MILFFYGPNTFLIHRKLGELKKKYISASLGDLNFVRLNGAELDFNEFSRQTQAMPLLATSRLIVIEDVLKNKTKEILARIKETLPKLPPSTNVVFVEYGEPDKRVGLFRYLQNPPDGGKSQYFGLLGPRELVGFVCDEVKARDALIEPEAAQALAEFSQGNLWFLSNEIEKLTCFARSRPITTRDVELLSTKNVSSNTFALVDFLAKKDAARALGELKKLIATNEPPLKILALVNYQFRTISQIKDARERKTRAPLSYYQLNKLGSFADKFSWKDLAQIYASLAAIDEKIKTGRIEGNEGLKELVVGLVAG